MTQPTPCIPNQLHAVLLDPESLAQVMTPALAIYPDFIDANIEATLRLLQADVNQGDVDRWQPHVKTAKLASTMQRLCAHGVRRFKCATTLEMLTACQAGAEEVLMSYPSDGLRAKRVRQIAAAYPKTLIAATVENPEQVAQWSGSPVSLYIDLNPGMNRTGIEQGRKQEIASVASLILRSGIRFAGLHLYEGHIRHPDLAQRIAAAQPIYNELIELVEFLRGSNLPPEVVITSGTPALPCALSFPEFSRANIDHRVSAGTVVYGDLSSLSQLPEEWGYQLGALVISSVISHPSPGIITCDAGHKAISADAGFPNCAVVGHSELSPQRPSEEHLPICVPDGVPVPGIGETLYLAPRHVCPTVNNFDEALLVREGKIVEIAKVSARGRESPLASLLD
jgi:D-serine deaminase-like pyridoxal phosphate-dependent protein